MKPINVLIIYLCTFYANANLQGEFDNRSSNCGSFRATENTPYKIHALNEPLVSNKTYPFQLVGNNDVIPQIEIVLELNYPDSDKTFKNRHGETIPIEEAVGIYVEFDNGTVEELESSSIPLQLKNNTTNTYGGIIFYRLKKESNQYGNGEAIVSSRFRVSCS